MDLTILLLYGTLSGILIVAGCSGLMWLNRRSFHRRNASGLEEFESFTKMMTIRLGEWIVTIVCVIAIVIAVGLFCWKVLNVTVPPQVQQFINGRLHKQ